VRFGLQFASFFERGAAAAGAAGEFRPEVVLLDIGMPRMDGCEVARRLRQMPEMDNVLLVALTGFGQEQDRQRSQEAGFNAHCVKPVHFDTLQVMLARPSPPGPEGATTG
jgi:CheY-like chemotaxis protein